MRELLIFSVYYPGAEQFELDFFSSVENQTNKDFTLLIVNDTDYELNLYDKYNSLSIIEIKGCSNIAKNRAIGINYAISHNYKFIMLCDIDDTFSPMRVEETYKYIKEYDIIVNDLNIVDSNNNILVNSYFSNQINEFTVLDKKFIKEKNIFGFSNTTINTSKLKEIHFPKDLKIVDWYYFTILLNQNFTAKFLPISLTNYRQHTRNMLGLKSYTVDVFKSQLSLKCKHYSYFKDIISGYDQLYSKMLEIKELTDNEIISKIIDNERNTPYPLWWENIK